MNIGWWKIPEDRVIRTGKEFLNYIKGWDLSQWVWSVPSDWEEPDVYVTNPWSICMEAIPEGIRKVGEWYVLTEGGDPVAIHLCAVEEGKCELIFMVRVRQGGYAIVKSVHYDEEEAYREMRRVERALRKQARASKKGQLR